MQKEYGKIGLRDASDADLVEGLEKQSELAGAANNEVNDMKSVREVTAGNVKSAFETKEKKLSSEDVDKYLSEFKTRFDALQQLHEGIEWAEVEKSLRADPESMAKLHALDDKGHAMNVFGEVNGLFIFVSAWNDYNRVSEDHRAVCFNPEGQKSAKVWGLPNGNAVDIVNALGVDFAELKFHEQLIKTVEVNGQAWLLTDSFYSDSFYTAFPQAFYGRSDGVFKNHVSAHPYTGSFRAELWVRKVCPSQADSSPL